MARTYRNVCKTLGERIRELREGKGLSREQVSKAAGIHIERLAELERGHTRSRTDNEVNPRLETLYRIAAALGVDVADLFRWEEKESPEVRVRQDILDLLKGHSIQTLRKTRQVLKALLSEPE
jgi:transcriptional regulator with XRE-family HTH domain